MIFTATALAGAFLIDLERNEDERGFFARSWCQEEFAAHGLNPRLVQCNISFSWRRGTTRGMHYQVEPHAESKLVRCTMGAIYDVILDLRPASATLGRWLATELTAQNRKALYIPEGVAHGLQTLRDETEVFYQMSEVHHPECARGVCWDDPAFAIEWPWVEKRIISDRDRSFPLWRP